MFECESETDVERNEGQKLHMMKEATMEIEKKKKNAVRKDAIVYIIK